MVPPPCGECLLCKGLLSYGDGVDETTWTESTSRAKRCPTVFQGLFGQPDIGIGQEVLLHQEESSRTAPGPQPESVVRPRLEPPFSLSGPPVAGAPGAM